MRYDKAFFDAGIDRRNTGCVKWDVADVIGEGGIPMWVADMDFAAAAPIVEAIEGRAAHHCYGYNQDCADNERTFCAFWQRRHGLAIQPEQTMMLPCVVTGLKLCVRTFTEKGDKVAIFAPVYGPFSASIRVNGRQVVSVPLLRNEKTGHVDMNLAGMEEALKDGAKLILLCNPHNPVARLWRRAELQALCQLARQYGAKIVSDEIHADFVYKPEVFTPLLSLPEAADCTVMLASASKTFNIAGLQQAELVCFSQEMLDRLRHESEAAGITSGNTFAMVATRAAYTQCDDWLDGMLTYLDESRAILRQELEKTLPKAVMGPIEATYLAFIDLRAYGITSAELKKRFKENGVALNEGTAFGPEGEGFMRLNFGCPHAWLREGVHRMGVALNGK